MTTLEAIKLDQVGREIAAMTAERDRLKIALEDAAFRLHTANVAGAFNSGEELSEYLATGYQNAHRALEAKQTMHENRNTLMRELQAMTAERDALVQTCGELCPHCGWRGLRGDAGECAFCQNAKLSADLFNMTAAKELAERQVALLCGHIDDHLPCWNCKARVYADCKQSGLCRERLAAWSRAEAEGGKG